MKDIHIRSLEVHDAIDLYLKELNLMNKNLRKTFPEEAQFNNDNYKFKLIAKQLLDSLEKLDCFMIKESTIYSLNKL